jgi:hypothetical protein
MALRYVTCLLNIPAMTPIVCYACLEPASSVLFAGDATSTQAARSPVVKMVAKEFSL